ncbi:efflux RND transporter periplasmic adaptor subunit, partial [uncultured Bilophila sp.]
EAAVHTASLNVSDTELFAPQDGVVLTRVHEVGAVVQPGQTVYAVTLNNPVWIRAYVTQPNLGHIRPGQEALLSIDATPGKTYRGFVGFISPTAEFTPKTVETKEVRNDLVFRFRVVAEDPDNVMRQGMPVTVTLRKDGGRP